MRPPGRKIFGCSCLSSSEWIKNNFSLVKIIRYLFLRRMNRFKFYSHMKRSLQFYFNWLVCERDVSSVCAKNIAPFSLEFSFRFKIINFCKKNYFYFFRMFSEFTSMFHIIFCWL